MKPCSYGVSLILRVDWSFSTASAASAFEAWTKYITISCSSLWTTSHDFGANFKRRKPGDMMFPIFLVFFHFCWEKTHPFLCMWYYGLLDGKKQLVLLLLVHLLFLIVYNSIVESQKMQSIQWQFSTMTPARKVVFKDISEQERGSPWDEQGSQIHVCQLHETAGLHFFFPLIIK